MQEAKQLKAKLCQASLKRDLELKAACSLLRRIRAKQSSSQIQTTQLKAVKITGAPTMASRGCKTRALGGQAATKPTNTGK